MPGLKNKKDTTSVANDTNLQNEIMIDDCFTVKRQRWGTFVSVDKDGNGIVTALTEEICIASTRWYLQAKQEGFTDDAPTYDGIVGGKL